MNRFSAVLFWLTLLASRALAVEVQAPTLSAMAGDGEVNLRWASNPPGYRLEAVNVLSGSLDWEAVDGVPVTVDGQNQITVEATGVSRYFRLAPAPLTAIYDTSPEDGEIGVAVFRETIIRFTAPLATNTVISPDNFYAGVGGRRLLTRIELSGDRRTATLFYLEPMPGGALVRAVFDGTGINDDSGRPIDPDGDGQPGGMAIRSFQTFNSTPLPNTGIVGYVYASEPASNTSGTNIVNHPLQGVFITVDGQEQTLRTSTDKNGYSH
ncbi:MAG TPA: hypothetical protein VF607_14490 [Verrucomicrobiae bacterium]